jgi:hypothetical protein
MTEHLLDSAQPKSCNVEEGPFSAMTWTGFGGAKVSASVRYRLIPLGYQTLLFA